LAIGLVFGVRDFWVGLEGINSSNGQGVELGIITMLPLASVSASLWHSYARRVDRKRMILRASVVSITVGLPIALLMVVGAAQ
jgi:hypothetical protein